MRDNLNIDNIRTQYIRTTGFDHPNVLFQLSNFIKNICARLDASLQEFGHISMLQLTRQWEVRASFNVKMFHNKKIRED